MSNTNTVDLLGSKDLSMEDTEQPDKESDLLLLSNPAKGVLELPCITPKEAIPAQQEPTSSADLAYSVHSNSGPSDSDTNKQAEIQSVIEGSGGMPAGLTSHERIGEVENLTPISANQDKEGASGNEVVEEHQKPVGPTDELLLIDFDTAENQAKTEEKSTSTKNLVTTEDIRERPAEEESPEPVTSESAPVELKAPTHDTSLSESNEKAIRSEEASAQPALSAVMPEEKQPTNPEMPLAILTNSGQLEKEEKLDSTENSSLAHTGKEKDSTLEVNPTTELEVTSEHLLLENGGKAIESPSDEVLATTHDLMETTQNLKHTPTRPKELTKSERLVPSAAEEPRNEEQEKIANALAKLLVPIENNQKTSPGVSESEKINELAEGIKKAMKGDPDIQDMFQASLLVFDKKEKGIKPIIRPPQFVNLSKEPPQPDKNKLVEAPLKPEAEEILQPIESRKEEVPVASLPEALDESSSVPAENVLVPTIGEGTKLPEPQETFQAKKSEIEAASASPLASEARESPILLEPPKPADISGSAEISGREVQVQPQETIPPSPFGTETVLIENIPVQTRTYEDATGKWYEAKPILRSVQWMSDSVREKFVRRSSIAKQNIRLIAQQDANNAGSLHVNESGLQELLDALVVAKAKLIGTSPSTKVEHGSQEVQKPVASPVEVFVPDGCNLAELLVSDEIINTPAYKDAKGTWFGTAEILANTKYANRRDIGKHLRRLAGTKNVRNIVQTTPSGKRGKLYANEKGIRKILESLGKSLDLVAVHSSKGATSTSVSQGRMEDRNSITSTSNEKGIYAKTELHIADQYVTMRTFTDSSGTWFTAIDLLKGLDVQLNKGGSSYLSTKGINQQNLRNIEQNSSTGKRIYSHVNMEGLRELLEFVSNIKGLNLSVEDILKEMPDQTMSVEATTESIPAPVSTSNRPLVTVLPSEKSRPFGDAEITLGNLIIPTRTYTDHSGLWFCTNDIFVNSGLKTPKAMAMMLRELDEKDVRKIYQLSPPGMRLMLHINEKGLQELLPTLNQTVEASSSTTPKANATPENVKINVDGKIIQIPTFTNEKGIWTPLQKLVKSTRLGNAHRSVREWESVAGVGNIQKLLEETSYEKSNFFHVNEEGLKRLLQKINGTVISIGNQPSPITQSTISDSTMEKEPIITMVGKVKDKCGTASVTFGSDKVTLPTYAEKDGTWYCVFDLLKESGFMSTSARSRILKETAGESNTRLIRRQLGDRNNYYSHVNKEGLKQLLGQLFGPRKDSNMNLGDALRPTPSVSRSLLTPVGQLLESKAPRPGDNSGVFTSLRIGIDRQTLLVKTYTDNHKTWYATPDMFELVEIFDEERQKDFLKQTLSKSDIKYIWQQYKDGLKLQAHVHKGALGILVSALNQFAENARNSGTSYRSGQQGVPSTPTPTQGFQKTTSTTPKSTGTLAQTMGSPSSASGEIRHGAETIEVNGKMIMVNTIHDSNGVWYRAFDLLNAAGIQGDQNRLAFIMQAVSSEHIRLEALPGNATQVNVDHKGLSELLKAIDKSLTPVVGGTQYSSANQPIPSSTPVSGASYGQKENSIETNAGVLGSTVIDLLGHSVTVKTCTLNGSVWFSTVDIVDGFNAFETAEGKPTTKRGDISHFVKANVDNKNIQKLFQKTGNQPGTRLVTHINIEGLQQLETALGAIRKGALPARLFAHQAKTAPKPPVRPVVQNVQVVPSFHPTTPSPQVGITQASNPQIPTPNTQPIYGKETVYMFGRQFEVRNVTDAKGKWYAVADVFTNNGIAEGSPQHEFITRNMNPADFQMFWQSGAAGIQKIIHVSSTGLFQMLNSIELLAQSPQNNISNQQPLGMPSGKDLQSLPHKIRQSMTKIGNSMPVGQRNEAWLIAEETRAGIISLLHNGRKLRFVKDSAGKVYVHTTDILPYLNRSRPVPATSYLDSANFVKIWTPGMKATSYALYIGMDNLEKVVSKDDNPQAWPFYEWCVHVAEPTIRTSNVIPAGL